MKSEKLYDLLERDFIEPFHRDDWSKQVEPISDYVTDSFKRRFMGVVCDNSESVEKVYTTVFPSKKVMKSVLERGEKDILLFVHHPATWDIRKAPEVFKVMDRNHRYGGEGIKNQKVALVTGGGNKIDFLEEIAEKGINLLVSGVTTRNEYSQEAHNYAKNKGISILGGTHYSTEKFACIRMCKYFEKQGLSSMFVEGEPVLEDL